MQKDMHYDGVYALARAAGINPQSAGIIATSSQFVDDALEDQPFDLSDIDERYGSVLPTMTSHKPLDYRNAIQSDQWRVWLPFHFLPGNEGRSQIERLTCKNNSFRPVKENAEKTPANRILEFSLKRVDQPWGLHLIGVAVHVYADTFSHYDFLGRSAPQNRVKNSSLKYRIENASIAAYVENKKRLFMAKNIGRLAEHVPVGHGSVATFPDRPYLRWKVDFEDGREMPAGRDDWRDNRKDFLKASEYLYVFFRRISRQFPHVSSTNSYRQWTNIKETVKEIIAFEGEKEKRVDIWKRNAENEKFYLPTREEKDSGGIPDYSDDIWLPFRVIHDLKNTERSDPKAHDGILFYYAAALLQRFIQEHILKDLGLVLIPASAKVDH